jgi:hypothetical protein
MFFTYVLDSKGYVFLRKTARDMLFSAVALLPVGCAVWILRSAVSGEERLVLWDSLIV